MRRVLSSSLVLVCLSAVAVPATAAASTINFAPLLAAGTPVAVFGGLRSFGTSLTYGGFTFMSNNATSYGLSVWEIASSNHPVGGVPTTSLFEYAAGYTTTITRSGGGAFELNGIDLANWGQFGGWSNATFDVTFLGTKSDASTVTQTFTVNNPTSANPTPVLQNFVFSGFTDLVNVSVMQGVYFAGTAFQFNNLVVDASSTTAVPEPASLLLLGSGVATLVLRRRGRRPS